MRKPQRFSPQSDQRELETMKMMKSALASLAIACTMATSAFAAGGDVKHADIDFSFDGPLGVYDRGALQRGLQVYQGVCAGCHGLKFVAFRTLADKNGPGLSEDQVKAFIAEAGYEVEDETGELAPAKAFDYFPEVTSAGAPDMSLLAKARADGAVHIYSILTGYTGEEKEVAGTTLYENTAYPGGWINMAPPLEGDDVEYADGREATLENESEDIAQFLMWAAEPTMVERKQAGIRNIIFLIIFAVLLFFVNRRIWASVKHPE